MQCHFFDDYNHPMYIYIQYIIRFLREHIEAGLENYDFILLSSKAIDMLTGGEPSCTTVNH